MDMNNSVNPSQADPNAVMYAADKDSVVFHREPPPPYSPASPTPVETVQPTRRDSTATTTIVSQPFIRSPMFRYCTKCKARVLTRVEYSNNNKTHFFAGIICGLTTWCVLCCLAAIPYLVNQCKSANHYCPNCKSYLGTYSKC